MQSRVQDPQCWGSLEPSKQVPLGMPGDGLGSGQHSGLVDGKTAVQSWLQAPQLARSLLRSKQPPPQQAGNGDAAGPAGLGMSVQSPMPFKNWPLPQVPQLLMSLLKSLQAWPVAVPVRQQLGADDGQGMTSAQVEPQLKLEARLVGTLLQHKPVTAPVFCVPLSTQIEDAPVTASNCAKWPGA